MDAEAAESGHGSQEGEGGSLWGHTVAFRGSSFLETPFGDSPVAAGAWRMRMRWVITGGWSQDRKLIELDQIDPMACQH